MNIERKISSSILFASWMLATLLIFTAYNTVQYTLEKQEKVSALQDVKNVELMLHTKYMEELLQEPYFVQEKNLFTSLAQTITSLYSPNEKPSLKIQNILKKAKEKGIYIDIFSTEGDKILSLTGKNDIATLSNVKVFTKKAQTFPPSYVYSFLRMDTHSLITRSFLLIPLKKYNSFLALSKQHSLLDKKILSQEDFIRIRKKTLTSFASSQYKLSFINKEAVSTLSDTDLLSAIQNFEKNIPTYIQYKNSTTLYATQYIPTLQGYLITHKTLSPLITTLNDILFTLLTITFVLMLLYTLLIPLLIKFNFLPLKKSIQQFQIFSENFSTFSKIDIMAIQSALPLINKKGDLENVSFFFTKILHSLNKKLDSFVETTNTDIPKENDICANIQKSFIPNVSLFKNNPSFNVHVNTISSSKTSNVFYDMDLLSPKMFYFTFGEVSQRNLKSILWSSTALKILKGITKHTYSPFESIKVLYTIMQNNSTDVFNNKLLTGFINLETGLVRYAGIGIPRILHIESEISEENFIIPLSKNSTPSLYQETIQLQKGDRLYLYNHTMNLQALQNIIVTHKDTFSKELFQMIISSEIAQQNNTPQSNDILSICIQFKEKENGTFTPTPTTIIGKDSQDNIIRSEGIY